MIRLLLRKCLQGLMMILIVSAVTFALLGFAGGDALTQLRDNSQISEVTIERLRSVYGLDQPLPVRYLRWLSGAVTGDLGESTYFRVPVSGLVWARLVNTFLLGTAAFAIALTFAVPLSLIGARYNSTTIAAFIDLLILVTASTPRIVLALVALAISVRLTASLTSSVVLFWLAALALSAPLISAFLAQLHGELQRTMREDFIKLARAKGLSESAVILRHAVRPALTPVLTIAPRGSTPRPGCRHGPGCVRLRRSRAKRPTRSSIPPSPSTTPRWEIRSSARSNCVTAIARSRSRGSS